MKVVPFKCRKFRSVKSTVKRAPNAKVIIETAVFFDFEFFFAVFSKEKRASPKELKASRLDWWWVQIG